MKLLCFTLALLFIITESLDLQREGRAIGLWTWLFGEGEGAVVTDREGEEEGGQGHIAVPRVFSILNFNIELQY